MNTTPAALQAHSDNTRTIGESDLLPRHPIFYTRDLEHARKHLGGVFVENSLAYLPRERGLDFRHRQAKLGSITVNSMQYGAGIMVTAPEFGDFYLLQFTLIGRCEFRQGRTCLAIPAGSVAVIEILEPAATAGRVETVNGALQDPSVVTCAEPR